MSDVSYDLSAVELRDSANPYVRFLDLLPVADEALLPQDAIFTPTIHAQSLGARLGMTRLYLKDETRLPTGTTKDRMAAVALAYMYECGVRAFSTSSTGNSSSAYARAISRMPGMLAYVFTASQFRERLALIPTDQVVDVVLEDATFVEAFTAAGDFAESRGLPAERGFFNPGRREGLKLAWLEAVDQVDAPIDWYVQAVSSGMGVYGVHKAATQLLELGLVDRSPHLLCVQQETCAPMVSAWRDGSQRIRPQDIVQRPTGLAAAILRGDPTRAYPHVQRIVAETKGDFVAASEAEIRETRTMVEDLEGLSPCFAASTAVAGVARMRREGRIDEDEVVLVNLTGSDRAGTPPTARTRWLTRSQAGWDFAAIDGE